MTEFLGSTDTDRSVGLYEPFLDNVVAEVPVLIAAIVLGIELVAGVLLALNLRPNWALFIGAFLNVQFTLAGVVNPSAFYLILVFTIVQWRMERKLSPVRSWRVARWSALAAGAATISLVPFISTVHPDSAMEDPALVLIFLCALFALGAWWTHKRIVAKVMVMGDLGNERKRSVRPPGDEPPELSRRSEIAAIPSTRPPQPRPRTRPGGSR